MNPNPGLCEEEAAVRLRRDGLNRLPPPQHKTFRAALLSVAAQPMVLLLLACTLLYAALGSTTDSVILGLSIVAVAAISVYQELRTQRVLEALRDLASPRSTVVRGGVVRRIASQELVAGDHLIVQEGDRMACDARLLEAHGLRVDESLLTGESVPVDKGIALGDRGSDLLHAGTLVVQGDGAAIVEATGIRTTLGRIGGVLASIEPRPSRLHEQLVRLVRVVAFLAVMTCVFAASVFAWRDGSWTAGLLVGLTLAMSIIPEEFAVVWTVMLALGAWRLARENVLTRQPQAVEALGATTVLCVDKTGTLTCNRMTVAAVFDGVDEGSAAEGRFAELLRVAALASTREGIEPMDQAIFRVLSAPDLPGRPQALLAVVIVQGAGRAAALPDEALRLAGLATIVVGNLAMLQWSRGGFGRSAPANRAFEGLVLAVCVLGGTVLLVAPLRAAFGLPLTIDAAPVLALLAAPAAWAVWRLFRSVALRRGEGDPLQQEGSSS